MKASKRGNQVLRCRCKVMVSGSTAAALKACPSVTDGSIVWRRDLKERPLAQPD